MKKLFKLIKLCLILIFKGPYPFTFIVEGKPVGSELTVIHLHSLNSKIARCRYVLTKEVVLNNLSANSIKIINSKKISNFRSVTTFQPCKI